MRSIDGDPGGISTRAATTGPAAVDGPAATTGSPTAPGPAATDRIIADFQATTAGFRCMGSERLMRLGVSMTQLHVLSLLQGHGDLPMSRLAEMTDVSLSNTTGLVDRIEERGLVERVRVPEDRRVVLVRLTAAGRELLESVELLRTATLRRILDRLAPDQLERLAAAAADLRAALAEETDLRSPVPHGHDHPDHHWRA
jgi:DNA-binding MarR family transcriptional regulator